MKERWIRLAAAVIVLLMLIPMRFDADDGGTRQYRAFLYCVTKRHSMTWEKGVFGCLTGNEVSILGIEVYSDVKFVPLERH